MVATLCGCTDARFVGVSPSESMARFMGVPSGEKMVARMRGLCYGSTDTPGPLHYSRFWRWTRMMKLFDVFGLILLYKTGINAITQEALSTYMTHYLCI